MVDSKSLIEAARSLATVCDGAIARDNQGFNRNDGSFVRSILSQNFITPKQASTLHRILSKYRSQLSGLGFQYEELFVPTNLVQFDRVSNEPSKEPDEKIKPKPLSAQRSIPDWNLTDDELLGHFPSRWKPYPQQIEAILAINKLLRQGKRFIVLEAGTGTGKTHIGMTIANSVRDSGGTHMLTANKQLQSQYLRDYPAPEIEVLKGRSNYKCTHSDASPDQDAAHGVCSKARKGILRECVDAEELEGFGPTVLSRAVHLELDPTCHRCPYWEALQKSHDASVSLFNFSSFLFQTRIGRFGKRAVMLIDEAHNVESQLMSFVSLELTEWALAIVGVGIERNVTSKEDFTEWLRETDLVRKIDNKIGKTSGISEDTPNDIGQAEADALRELQDKLQNFLAFLDKTEWILETIEYRDRRGNLSKKIVARPLYATEFAEDLLFRHADRIIAMSATILNVSIWCKNLGIDPNDVGCVQVDCEFPIENRPIFLTYVGNCGRKTLEETKPKLVKGVRIILNAHSGQRGIIHTQSFDLSRLLRDQLASPRFLFQDQFRDKDEMLEEHARRTDSVIVAPAMAEGLDLKGELGRFQIILKVPYPSLGDKVIAERLRLDERYFAWLTALKFVQSTGRIVRGKEDWGWTYVLDSGFEGFLKRNGQMIPAWIKKAFRYDLPKEVRRD